MKHIVICGAGFGGVSTALSLAKSLPKNSPAKITLISKEPYHLVHSNLYEVATSPEDLTTLPQLKDTVVVPLAQIFQDAPVTIKQGTVEKADPDKRQIKVGGEILQYDYAVLALGATSNFYGISGAEEYSQSVMSAEGALRIRNQLEFAIQASRQDIKKQIVRIVIAGGGFVGVELAGELKGFLDFLAWKNSFPREKLEIVVVEGGSHLLPGLDEQVEQAITQRLKDLEIVVKTGLMVTKVDKHFVEFNTGERLTHDCLVWTAGIKANTVAMGRISDIDPGKDMAMSQLIEQDRGQCIIVNDCLQIKAYPNIFVLGDQACFLGPDHRPLPATARQAIDQGRYVGRALAKLLQNRKPEEYRPRQFGYIIPVGGKWAVLKTPNVFLAGRLPYFLRLLGWLRYYQSILGWRRAWQMARNEAHIYFRND